jgi:hypothetical protein
MLGLFAALKPISNQKIIACGAFRQINNASATLAQA